MEAHFDFGKRTISSNVSVFLIENLPNEEEIVSLKKILKGRKLNFGDANALLRSVIQSLVLINKGFIW